MNVVDRNRMWALVVAAAVLAGAGLVAAGPADAEGGCAENCRHAYNQCRIQTKGSPSCEGQFTSCMQGCRR